MVKPRAEDSDEFDDEEEDDEPPRAKKAYSKKGKKGKGGDAKSKKKELPMFEDEDEDSEAMEMESYNKGKKGKKKKGGFAKKKEMLEEDEDSDIIEEESYKEKKGKKRKGGKKKGKKKEGRIEMEKQEESDVGKFVSDIGKVDDFVGDNLRTSDVKKDVTIEMDVILPPTETEVLHAPLSSAVTPKEDFSIEIPDSSTREVVEDFPLEVNANDAAVLSQSLEEEMKEDPTILLASSDRSESQKEKTEDVGIDISESHSTRREDPPLKSHAEGDMLPLQTDNIPIDPLLGRTESPDKKVEAVTIDIPDSPREKVKVLPQETSLETSLERPGSPAENVEAVAIDIPESPRDTVMLSPLETITSFESGHTREETLPIENNISLDRPASPNEVEAVAIDIPEVPAEFADPPLETEVSLDAREDELPSENMIAEMDVEINPGPDKEVEIDVHEFVVDEVAGDVLLDTSEKENYSIAEAIAATDVSEIKKSEESETVEAEINIQLEKTASDLKDEAGSKVSADPVDLLAEGGVNNVEYDVATKEAAIQDLPSEESKDVPLARRNYEPNKSLKKGIDDQDFDLTEDNEAAKPEDTSDKILIIDNDDELPWAMYKQKKEKQEEIENANRHDEEIPEISDSDDEDYVPGINEDLPDSYEVMNELDTEDIELNLKTSPPSILTNTQQNVYNEQVQKLKQGIAEDEIKIYLDDFEDHVKREILMIGNISLEDVQEEERHLREEHISFQQQQAKIQRTRQQEILQAMEKAKKYVMSKYKEKYRELRTKEQHLLQRDRSYKDEIHREFRRSESQLRKALKRRKAEVKTMYGDLIFADGQYGGSKGRRWKIDWNRAPQPIQIRLKCLRGVKDKLPSSRYVLMVSLYNRLGGNVMKWSSLRGQQWGGATLPILHDGEFFNIEMKIDQSVFTVCPSSPDIRPGMALVFELFILRGPVTPTDKVVGWGCFPLCDAEFKVIEGKYKTPMLRGDLDPGIDKFEIIEKLIANDLENWLCNAYFEIIRLPRYMAGQKEYEVELQFTSGLLGAPNRTKTGEENIDGEKAIFGSRSDVNSVMSHHSDDKSRRSPSITSSNNDGSSDNKSMKKVSINTLTVVDTIDRPSTSESGRRRQSSMAHSSLQMYRAENLSADLRRSKVEPPLQDNIARPMTSVDASRKLNEEKGLQLSDDGSEDSDYGDNEVYALRQDMGYKPVKGEPGMFYKIHYNTPAEVYARKVYTMMPKTPLLSQRKAKKKMSHMEILNTHSFAVKTPWSNKGHIDHKGTKKIQYIGRMLFSELGISQTKSRAFWAMLLMIVINFWIRLYLHYVGQWVALQGFGIPINEFIFLPYTVNLNYQNTLLRTREEIALIVIGPFTVIILFVLMVIISAFIQLLFERFPDIFSKFIMAFGIHSVLDPIWILIVDSALLRYEDNGSSNPIGDAFKLYYHFKSFWRSGSNPTVTLFISIALTTFLYFVTIFCALAILYMYFMRLHNNGRLMDVYWRLHGTEKMFFIPYDLEISNEELSFICTKGEQWRGEEGERRKTAVYDYVWEQEEMTGEDWDNPHTTSSAGRTTGARETTTHISIHTLHLDGLRELYRHFLKLPDGAIVEVFGQMNIPGIDEGVKQALMKRTTFETVSTNNELRRRPASGASMESIRKERGDGAGTANLDASPVAFRKPDKMSTVDFLGIPQGVSHA